MKSGRRFPWATAALIVGMIFMTGWSLIRAHSWFAAPPPVLIELGANTAFYTFDHGGLWRLLASKFLLGSLVGCAAVLPLFWIAAGAFERSYGSMAELVVFVGVGVLSGIATLITRDSTVVVTGSGALALCFATCMAILALRRTSPVLEEERRPFLIKLGAASALFLLVLVPGIILGSLDVASLGTGLVSGLLLGYALAPVDAPPVAGRRTRLGAVAATLAVLSVAAFVAAPRPPYVYSDHVRLVAALKASNEELNALNEELEARLQAVIDAAGDPSQLVPYLEGEWLPKWSAMVRKLQDAPHQDGLSNARALARTEEYVGARGAFVRETAIAWKSDDDAAFVRAAAQRKRLTAALLAIDAENARISAARTEPKP